MKTSEFYYDLPESLIAQVPIENRSESRLMVMDKKSGAIKHRIFKNIIDELNPGDCLVLNNTRVLPARLLGLKAKTGGKIELLLLKRLRENQWETMVKPGKKARVGDVIEFGKGILTAQVLEIVDGGNRIVAFSYEGIFEEILDQLGQMPLPPYITETLVDQERYQTVYSKHKGSAAAPTAGLHFTNELLEALEVKGIHIAYLTLHVGIGTFRPVKVENILEHEMHSEYYMVDAKTAEIINRTKASGHRVIAVGTTSSRTLESVADENGLIKESSGWTDIFIYPGYHFKCVDGLITNFHLPESTLIMLVSALATKTSILNAYQIAVEQEYRFFSFGDAMFIR